MSSSATGGGTSSITGGGGTSSVTGGDQTRSGFGAKKAATSERCGGTGCSDRLVTPPIPLEPGLRRGSSAGAGSGVTLLGAGAGAAAAGAAAGAAVTAGRRWDLLASRVAGTYTPAVVPAPGSRVAVVLRSRTTRPCCVANLPTTNNPMWRAV